jgi:hypothetical protein
MNEIISKNPLVHKIIAGEAKEELIEMLLSRQLPFTEEEYLESLVFLQEQESLKFRAKDILNGISEATKENYVDKSFANEKVAHFILTEALELNQTNIIGKIVRNQSMPHQFLVEIGERGGSPMLEILLENQIKLIAYSEILDAMDHNPTASNYIKSKTKEIRDFYISDEKGAEIKKEDVIEEIKEVISGEREEDEPAEEIPAELIEERAVTLLQRINEMSISERIKMALTGDRSERMILIKDANKMVSSAVIHSPKVTEDEVVLIVRNKSLPGEIIGNIAKKREWTKNYIIMLELVQNPKTPVKDALGFIKRLHPRDLKQLSRDKNISPVVRQLAMNIQRQKEKLKR